MHRGAGSRFGRLVAAALAAALGLGIGACSEPSGPTAGQVMTRQRQNIEKINKGREEQIQELDEATADQDKPPAAEDPPE